LKGENFIYLCQISFYKVANNADHHLKARSKTSAPSVGKFQRQPQFLAIYAIGHVRLYWCAKLLQIASPLLSYSQKNDFQNNRQS